MTADAAGSSERERLARILYGIAGGSVRSDTWGTDNAAPDDVKRAYFDADTLMLAGFGDAAEAWDEGATWAWAESGEGWNGEYPGEPVDLSANPHRTPSANGGGA